MKKNIFLVIILFFFQSQAQKISGKIVDKENEPIKNARVGIESEEIGDISDENGNFQIDFSNIEKNKNLKVVVSEFQPFEIKISDFINSAHQIILKEKFINIEPVIINPKKYILRNFGTSNSKTNYCGYDSEKKDKIFNEYAIKISNKRHLKIKNINVNIVNFKLNKPAVLIFDIQNAKNGFPDDSQSLANETLKLELTEDDIRNNKVSLNVEDKNIWTNQDFFVLVRVDENLDGRLYFGGNIFAFSKNTYYRNYFGDWKKFSVGEPSINVDVLIQK
ncbi:carboxypeptidase-like regulatory domain-containing protein [Chryseobacterium oryzae]|uniref:Carboxypeptidase-like regulatory domain-containing protein n=1 Tax=Chryseobacterium oryzae TaxID=2929799 RepID=A0ABY4BIW9_9FLAO|nr:carboxypeptidase-like regulatory domain-containing protein [Chryseobacterium oryzae]UOE39143.1 carboxypeptidase-like regulatory domain-containing protein [Chryseobacterium oryzae]